MERGSGVAMWRQIEDRMKEDIVSGNWKPGDRLPTESELAERFGVNRHTLRRALSALRDDGLVRIEQGRGTFVQDDVIDYAVRRRTRFSENISNLGRQPSGEVVRAETVAADTQAASALEIRRGQKVVLLELLSFVDGRPVSIGAHQFPQTRFRGLDKTYRETGSITKALRQFGVDDYFRKLSRVSARLPEPEDAHLLNMARAQPILYTESVNVDRDGKPIEYCIARYAGHRMQLVFEL
ncbi:MAG: phosphonate metabolism transcriptional regulator PhnF [Pseudomonadota bacterium]